MKIPKSCQVILKKLNDNGFEAYIVGGCVRDSLLGKIPSDWDICTSATPDEMLQVFSEYKVIPTGITHGTVTILVGKDSYEVTTYRIDGEYKDHRRPNEVQYTSDLKEDLSRRDFTINAMAYHPKEGLIDYFGGRSDLEKRVLKAVGDPLVRFEEDALRLLRFIRFATVLSFDYDKETLKAIKQKIHLLKYIAKERIQVELNKILCAKDVARGLYDLGQYGFYQTIAPEICHQYGFTQGKGHFLDVFEHSLLATSLVSNDLILRLTLFLHDIGKPYTLDENDEFPLHENIGSQLANQILRDLKYDNYTRKEVVKLILHHNDNITDDEISIRRVLKNLGLESTKRLLKVKIADILAHRLSDIKRKEIILYFEQIENKLDEIIERADCFEIKTLKISGNDLKSLGFQGKAIKTVLDSLLDEVIISPEKNHSAWLLEKAQKFYQSSHLATNKES